MQKNKRREITDDAFFGFAKSYFSEAFPNPHRIGCPAESDLKRRAGYPTEADTSSSHHLTGCPPCFNRYICAGEPAALDTPPGLGLWYAWKLFSFLPLSTDSESARHGVSEWPR